MTPGSAIKHGYPAAAIEHRSNGYASNVRPNEKRISGGYLKRLPSRSVGTEILARNLQRRDTHWNVLAQQVMMMSLDCRQSLDASPGKLLNLDSWAGYEAQRRRLLARMRGLNNVVVLTGDEHTNYAGLLHDREQPVAVEFVATSISSDGDGQDMPLFGAAYLAHNPQLKFVNNQRGYLICDVTPDEWRTNFMVVDQVSTPGGRLAKRATWTVAHGQPAMHLA